MTAPEPQVATAALPPLAMLTRPAGRNEDLARGLADAGFEPWVLPALSLSDTVPDRHTFPAPHGYDLLLFVSGAAVRAYRRQCARLGIHQWPTGVWAAAVGPATDAAWDAPMAALSVPPTWRLTPQGEGDFDSEHLLRTLDQRGLQPRRILVVRAGQGRNWLAQQWQARGADVAFYAAYARAPQGWSAQTRSRMQQAAAQRRQAYWLVTSTESWQALHIQLQNIVPEAWWRQGAYIATHPRLADLLHCGVTGAGSQAMVQICLPLDTSIQCAFVALRTAVDSLRAAR